MDSKKAEQTTMAHSTECQGADRSDGDQIDAGAALQSFLNHIPITSIPSLVRNSPVLELRSNDCIRDAISLLYTENVSGALIVDDMKSDFGTVMDRYIGFIGFSSIFLWSLEEFDKARAESKCDKLGFLSMLEQISQIGQTKIGELAKSFLWEPFFPVTLNDTLFHVLLLFSKHHRLKVIPVIESANSSVIGFVTQNAVVQLLLQSSGLEWFDQIADKAISEFGFEKSNRVLSVYEDQAIADALHILREEQIDGVPVVDRRNETLMGTVRCSDLHLLLDDDKLFDDRKCLTVEEFIKSDAEKGMSSVSTEGGTKALPHAGALSLKEGSHPRMSTLVTNQQSNTLKQAMENLVASNSTQSFLVSELGKLEGVVTLRDVLRQFSPPEMDSRIDGGGFFQSALDQAGCCVKNGSLICNH